MKKHTVVALVSALAIAAGTIAAGSLSGAAGINTSDAGVSGTADSISYDDAIAELYARSTSISDQEILEIARKMKPDGTAAARALGEDEADAILETLSLYESEKASYLLGSDAAGAEEAVSREWEKQYAYTQMGMGGGQSLTSLIPGYTITSCREEDGKVLVDVDEWMTEGYTEGQDRDTVNVSAYRYYVTAVLAKDSDGAWNVASVTNTDRNYTWLEDIEEQEKQYGGGTGELFAAAEETKTAAAAAEDAAQALAAAQAGDIMTSTLKTYGDGKYTYSPDKAVAYADKWATSRNPQYKQYPGVDCCNFVSQCLYAGGMPKNSTWYPASYDWINCSGAISNFKKYGKFMSANDSNVLKGNPVYYDWNSNGVYDHTAICVGRNSAGTPIIDAHTGDHYHATWRLGNNGKRATIQLRNSGNTSGSTSSATGGKWVKKNGKWYYYKNGKAVRGWLTYKNQTYFLSKSGIMVTGWYKIGNAWYYFAKSGEMRTGWLNLGSRKFYLSDRGRMKTGWVCSNGKWYYMCSEGYAVTGWKTIKGETYYFNGQCVMQTGLTKIDGMNYYFDSQGHKTLGWVTVRGKKYFFSPSAGGRAATGYWDINNRYYYFNSEGVLQD